MNHTTRATKACIIMPAFNEEASIGSVVSDIKTRLPEITVVVMNDGSADMTAEIAQRAGATVVSLPFNLGIGGAVQLGLRFAADNDFDFAIEVDADGQHDPAHIAELLAAAEKSGADLVIGSRFKADTEYRSSPLRRFGIHTFSFLIKMVTGKRIYDSTSGFRVYSKQAVAYLKDRYPTDFPEPESIVMLLTNGFSVNEVPVVMKKREAGSSVVGRDLSLKALYFVVSNAIAIVMTSLKPKNV